MNKQGAERIRDHVLAAIESLTKALRLAKSECDEEQFKILTRAVGVASAI